MLQYAFCFFCLLSVASSHLRKDESQVSVINVLELNNDILEFELSQELPQICTSIILDNHFTCSIKELSSQIHCDLPLIISQDVDLSDLPPVCFISCGNLCNNLLNSTNYLSNNQRTLQELIPSPSSFSFVYPTYLKIPTTDDISKTVKSMYLFNDDNRVNIYIIRKYIPYSIDALVKGGPPGDYKLKIECKDGTLIENPVIFSIKTVVESVIPAEGTVRGGIILHLKGSNFSLLENQNFVKIGDVPCDVFSYDTTNIYCKISPTSTPQPTVDTPYEVVVYYNTYSSSAGPMFQFKSYDAIPTIDSVLGSQNNNNVLSQGEQATIRGNNLSFSEEQTILYIQETEIPITHISSSEIIFTVPQNLKLIQSQLEVFVGKYGSCPQTVSIVVRYIESQCFNSSLSFINSNVSDEQLLYFDLNLSSYYSGLEISVQLDNQTIQPNIIQPKVNSNHISVRVMRNQLQDSSLIPTAITSILINNLNQLQSPINLIPSNSNQISSANISFKNTRYFGLLIIPVQDDLTISRLVLKSQTSDYEIEGIQLESNPLAFQFRKIYLEDSSPMFLEGCSNHGQIHYVPTLPNDVYTGPGRIQWTLLNDPFESNKFLIPGKKFAAEFSYFDELTNFFGLTCTDTIRYPLLWKEKTEYNTYLFRVPPRINGYWRTDDISDMVYSEYDGDFPCYIEFKDEWSTFYDQYVTGYIYETPKSSFPYFQTYWPSYTYKGTEIYNLVYPKSSHMVITSFSPSIISYLGGEEVTFSGNLRDVSIDLIDVTINRIKCQVTEATTFFIKCISGFQQSIDWFQESSIVIHEEGIQVLVATNTALKVSFRQVDPLPFLGSEQFFNEKNLFIPKSYEFILDDQEKFKEEVTHFEKIYCLGYLDFEPVMDYNIEVKWMVGSGGLNVGREDSFINQSIQFTVSEMFDIYKLYTYGSKEDPFFYLVESAFKDSAILSIDQRDIIQGNFKVGDKLLISGTKLGTKEEIVTILALNENEVILKNSLKYDHIVNKESFIFRSGETFDSNVSPTVVKVNKTIQLILKASGDKDPDGSIGTKEYFFQGVTLYLEQIPISRILLWAYESILDINWKYGTFPIINYIFEKTVIFDMWPYSSIYAVNCLFIARNTQVFGKNDSMNFEFCTFQNIILETFTTRIYNILIYNTPRCITTYLWYLEFINITCFSANISFAPLSYFHNLSRLPLIAIDVDELDLYGSGGRIGFLPMILKSTSLSNSNQQKSTPILIIHYALFEYYNYMNYYSFLFDEVYIFGYSGQLFKIDDQLQKYMVFKQSRIIFPMNDRLINPEAQLAIFDEDGGFNDLGSKSSIFTNGYNLHDSTDCQVGQYYSICPYEFSQFYQVIGLTKDNERADFSNCKFILKRKNGMKVNTNLTGFAINLGETYEGYFEDRDSNFISITSISLLSMYSSNPQRNLIIRYVINEDTPDYNVATIYTDNIEEIFTLSKKNLIEQLTEPLSADTCKHGQSYQFPNHIEICYNTDYNQSLTLNIFSSSKLFPFISNEQNDSNMRQFEKPESWIRSNGQSTQKPYRWTIQSNWNMLLNKGAVYDIKNLVVQGNLVIDGNEDITINTNSIYIAAGTIKISSSFTGKLIINLNIANEDIFCFNLYKEKIESHFQGTFLINNELNIESHNSQGTQTYRLISFLNDSQDKIIVAGIDETIISQGDEVFIICPRTGNQFSSIVQSVQISDGQTVLQLNSPIDYTFFQTGLFTINSYEINLQPYLKVIPKRIIIKNANIKIDSFGFYHPSVSISGVSFENSSITLSSNITSVQIDSSSFFKDSSTTHSSRDFYIFSNSVWTSPDPPKISLSSNLFFDRDKLIKITSFVVPKIELVNSYSFSLDSNLMIKSTISIQSEDLISLKNNVIINASTCLISPKCPNLSSDQLFKCNQVAVNAPCTSIENISVGFSRAIFSYSFTSSLSHIVSISNINVLNSTPDFQLTYLIMENSQFTINDSIIIADLVEPNETCSPTYPLQLFMPSFGKFIISQIIVNHSTFSHFSCSPIIKYQDQAYLPLVIFQNSKCDQCSYTSILELVNFSASPSTLLVKDYSNSFISSINFGNSLPLIPTFISEIQLSPFIQLVQPSKALGRLFVTSLIVQITQSTFSQRVIDSVGTIFILESENIFTISNASEIISVALKYQSPDLPSLEYIQIKFKPLNGNGIKIRREQETIYLKTNLNTNNGFNIKDLVQNDVSQIQCSVSVYDYPTDTYYILLTNSDNCLIQIYQFVVPQLVIVLALPDEIGLCNEQRQSLNLIKKIALLFNIAQNQVRVIAQKNIGTCNARILSPDTASETVTVSTTFVVQILSEADADETNEKNCIQNNCSEEEKLQQEASSQAANVKLFESLQNFQSLAASQGLNVANVQTTLSSGCNSDQVYYNGSCVSSCADGYYIKSGICLKCHSSCVNCTSNTSYDCSVLQSGLACASNYNTFTDKQGLKYCGQCPSHCQSCSQLLCPQSLCLAGYSNFEGQCLEKCNTGYFSLQGNCTPCPSACNTCDSSMVCTSCRSQENNPKTLCEPYKLIEENSETNNLPLILGLSIGLVGGLIVLGIVGKVVFTKIKHHQDFKTQNKYKTSSQEQEEEFAKNTRVQPTN